MSTSSDQMGVFTTALSLTQAPLTTIDANGIASTTTTQSIVADILSWLPDGNYTYLSWTFLPVSTASSVTGTATQSGTTLATSLSSSSGSTATSSATASATALPAAETGLSNGAIAGVVIGSVAGVSAAAVLAYLFTRYRRKALRGTQGGSDPRWEIGGSDGHASEVEGKHVLEMQGSEQHPSEMEGKHIVEMGGAPGDEAAVWAMHDVKGHVRPQAPVELGS
ncbi:hypothetical protein F5Y15DRAFT_254675 [Xylariaceae sp. FL0016]|nr:hypothetical protein F5Y15DRAFT_254675 [Xylariaceae sp. FL0016]